MADKSDFPDIIRINAKSILQCSMAALHNQAMRIAIVDESASRAAAIHEGLAALTGKLKPPQ